MAWGLKRQITSRTISSAARRIPVSNLMPGDAVWKPGHVSIFERWKDRSKRQYYALEQTTWGGYAMRRVRTVPGNGRAYRYKRLTSRPRRAAPARPAIAAAAPAVEASPSTGSAAAAGASP